jgi:ABC-2 type transport system permease protein
MIGRVKNELEKIWLRKRNIGFFLAAAGICLAWAALIWTLGNGGGVLAGGPSRNGGPLPGANVLPGGNGLPAGNALQDGSALSDGNLLPDGSALPFGALPIVFNLAYSPLTVLAFVAELYVPALSAFLAADLYTAEIKSGYIKWLCAAPADSAAVYFSKLLAMVVFVAANIFALFLASLAFALLLPVGGLSAAGIREALTAYAVTVVPAASVAAMLAFVAMLFESRFAAIFTGAALYAGARIAGAASGAVADASFLSYMQWHVLWVGGALPARKLLSVWLMLLSGGAAFAAAGCIAMARRAASHSGGARAARRRGMAGGRRARAGAEAGESGVAEHGETGAKGRDEG